MIKHVGKPLKKIQIIHFKLPRKMGPLSRSEVVSAWEMNSQDKKSKRFCGESAAEMLKFPFCKGKRVSYIILNCDAQVYAWPKLISKFTSTGFVSLIENFFFSHSPLIQNNETQFIPVLTTWIIKNIIVLSEKPVKAHKLHQNLECRHPKPSRSTHTFVWMCPWEN